MASIIDQPLLTCWALNVAIMPLTAGFAGSTSSAPKLSVPWLNKTWICLKDLKGPPKIKHMHYRFTIDSLFGFPSSGGFPIGKINNHLKSAQQNSTKIIKDHPSVVNPESLAFIRIYLICLSMFVWGVTQVQPFHACRVSFLYFISLKTVWRMYLRAQVHNPLPSRKMPYLTSKPQLHCTQIFFWRVQKISRLGLGDSHTIPECLWFLLVRTQTDPTKFSRIALFINLHEHENQDVELEKVQNTRWWISKSQLRYT